MDFAEFLFEGTNLGGRCLDDKKRLSIPAEILFPVIKRNNARKNIHAGGQPLPDKMARYLFTLT